jgi:hypothetical protein
MDEKTSFTLEEIRSAVESVCTDWKRVGSKAGKVMARDIVTRLTDMRRDAQAESDNLFTRQSPGPPPWIPTR